MKPVRALLLLTMISAGAAAARAAWADTVQAAMPAGTLSVRSVPEGAEVVLDSVSVGVTPVVHLGLPPGMYSLRVYAPSRRSWEAVVAAESLSIRSGDTVERTFSLQPFGMLRSIPSGVVVRQGATFLGVTPFDLRAVPGGGGMLELKADGYLPLEVAPDSLQSGSIIRLRPGSAKEMPAGDLVAASPQASDRRWYTIGSAGVLVLSGVLAAYWKDQANREYDVYLATRNPALLDSTHRLDRGAGIALAVTQLSFLVLSYLLLSE